MTPEAKTALSATIRRLRDRLLAELHQATESAYRLSITAEDATLSEANRVRRARLETWVDEQVRALPKKQHKGAAERFRLEVEKDAAAALLQRLVFLRLLEANGLRGANVVTDGWESRGYKDFRELAPALVQGDDTEGYAALLRLIFDELAVDLPGLFGDVRLTGLVPVPPKTLRAVIEALDDPAIESCWTDDMTLGWIYQYWNDSEREALDAKILARKKLEHHELPAKTQMFTDRYLVEWLLHNSLGPMWLAMCAKHGWTAEVEADETLARLEERRAEWRAKREAGEVELTELMPLHTDAERRWAYYVPQPIPNDAVVQARDSVRDLKILDPAVGSGHFLVVAFDLLAALYREEARHRGEEGQEQWSDRAIAERIVEHNLHGIDLDPRAVQIAAAALWLKLQSACPEAHPRHMNLVASNLRLSSLAQNDPARTGLCAEVERETGIPSEVTQRVLAAIAGADHLGSLLKVDEAVDESILACETALSEAAREQGELFNKEWREQRVAIDFERARSSLLNRLEHFLQHHGSGENLGLKLRGEQLAAGVRFIRMMAKGSYDLIVANPPYQGTSKLADSKYVEKLYPLGKADLFAAFMLRSLELVREGGVSAMLTMRNWMFIKQYARLRAHLLGDFDIRALGDFDKGAFEGVVTSQLVSVCLCVIRRAPPSGLPTMALQPTAPGEKFWSRDRTELKRAAVLCQRNRYEFNPAALKVVPEWPLVYWWPRDQLAEYAASQLTGTSCPARFGLTTGDNPRYCRTVWEIDPSSLGTTTGASAWVPLIHGAKGTKWIDPTSAVLKWYRHGAEVKVKSEFQYGSVSKQIRNEDFYFTKGIAFSAIGSDFGVRAHRLPGVFSNTGLSLFPKNVAQSLATLATSRAARVASDLAPGIRFDVGDVNRIPLVPVAGAEQIFAILESAFSIHEAHRETSLEFRKPGASPWRYAQEWAQRAVDRAKDTPLPPYVEQLHDESPIEHVSFAVGVAIGRFGPDNSGVVGAKAAAMRLGLARGIFYLDGSLRAGERADSLGQPAADVLHKAWSEYSTAIGSGSDLRRWLRVNFFKDLHKRAYDGRPIYFPLSSTKRTFVAHVAIHRWDQHTLRGLLAEHLQPSLARIEGQLIDARSGRQAADKATARAAERRTDQLVAWRDELDSFIAKVEDCAERGPPPPDSKTHARESDARYAPNLDDGVMINSAALWPLLEPQWKDPKKCWKQLALAKGKTDYDWSHLAARYFPSRVDKKCQNDPSLGVAHGCFWKYHPEIAYRWELRLQDEIGPAFTIDEDGSDEYRAAFEAEHPDKVAALVAKEQKRRDAKRKKQQKLDLDQAQPTKQPDKQPKKNAKKKPQKKKAASD